MLKSHPSKSVSFAFFDVDETLISTKSMFGFIDVYFSMYPDHDLKKSLYDDIKQQKDSGTAREVINRHYYSYFTHFPIRQVLKACQEWFNQQSANPLAFYHSNVVQLLKQHQANGYECVFVSGSFRELLQPIADALGVHHILSINLERHGLAYTGNIIPPQTIGDGKAQALSLFLAEHHSDPESCFAYGDDISDAPMLELVGSPMAVSGSPALESYAKKQGWSIVHPYE